MGQLDVRRRDCLTRVLACVSGAQRSPAACEQAVTAAALAAAACLSGFAGMAQALAALLG